VQDLDVFLGLYEARTEFTTTCRLDALVNDLNFMIPERFIDEFNLSIRASMYEPIYPQRIELVRLISDHS